MKTVETCDKLVSHEGNCSTFLHGLYLRQIYELVRKDFIVLLAHRRSALLELIFPIMMACMSCIFMAVMLPNLRTFWSTEGYPTFHSCWGHGYLSPNPFNFNGVGTCIHDRYIKNLDKEEDIQPAFERDYLASDNTWDPYFGLSWNRSNFSLSPNQRGSNMRLRLRAHNSNPDWMMDLGTDVFKMLYNDTHDPAKQVRYRYVTQSYFSNVRQVFATASAIMLAGAFLPMLSSFGGRLVDEKRARIREHMRVMGVKSSAYILSTLITAVIRTTFITVSMTLAIAACGILDDFFDALLMWVSLELFGISLAGFAQILPAFFNRPQYSSILCSIFLSGGAVAAPFVSFLPDGAQIAICWFLSPCNVVMCLAQLLGKRGVTLPMSPEHCFAALAIQAAFYSVLSQYLYNIHPGDYGVAKSPLYPLHAIAALLRPFSSSGTTEGSPVAWGCCAFVVARCETCCAERADLLLWQPTGRAGRRQVEHRDPKG